MREGFIHRRLVQPVIALLSQGITPEKIALSLAIGIVLGVFPVLGSTTLLCAAAAMVFRLNLPAIQLVNYIVYPLQLALFVPAKRLCLRISRYFLRTSVLGSCGGNMVLSVKLYRVAGKGKDRRYVPIDRGENFWLHKFRATFATWSLWAGVDLRTVQQWLGHSDVESTMRYRKPSRSQHVRDKGNEIFA